MNGAATTSAAVQAAGGAAAIAAGFTEQQLRRLHELGLDTPERIGAAVDTLHERGMAADLAGNVLFQRVEKLALASTRADLLDLLAFRHEPQLCTLSRTLARALEDAGFTQVVTPTVISSAQIDKMTITSDKPLRSQVYWLDGKSCLRPMLAPGLYTVSRKLFSRAPMPLRMFEIGSCFRKESEGQHHLSEFTMLDLVEWGTPLDEREQRLDELMALVLDAAGLGGTGTEEDMSVVYGKGIDSVDANGLELGSSSMGPHPLDAAWDVDCSWVGIGFGLERLLQSRASKTSVRPFARSTSYLDGASLNLK